MPRLIHGDTKKLYKGHCMYYSFDFACSIAREMSNIYKEYFTPEAAVRKDEAGWILTNRFDPEVRKANGL
jgi:hypothetical protein